jgi:hypothetical protein
MARSVRVAACCCVLWAFGATLRAPLRAAGPDSGGDAGLAGATAQAEKAQSDSTPDPQPPHGSTADTESALLQADRWIEQLGSERYELRARAEGELTRLGVDVFDRLKRAENHPDLEIATRARAIVQRIPIGWFRPTDPPEIQKWMAHYDQLPFAQRILVVERLAALDTREALFALCRVARFDSAGQVSREAAVQILRSGSQDENRKAWGCQAVASELGRGNRTAVTWLRAYFDQLNDPASVVQRWAVLIDAEMELLDQESPETDRSIVLELLRYHLNLCAAVGQTETALEVLERIDQFLRDAGAVETAGLTFALKWILRGSHWTIFDRLEAKEGDAIQAERSLLYLAAAVYARRGREEEANTCAERAFVMGAGMAAGRNPLARLLLGLGHFDWAEREWREILLLLPASSDEALTARDSLSMWLHDRLRHLEAAQLLQQIQTELEGDAKQLKAALKDPNIRFRLGLLSARMEYYFACDWQAREDYQAQRNHLQSALDHNQIDADVLIAKYHLQGADPKYRQETVAQIEEVRKLLEKQIRDYAENQTLAASYCNHLAWLVANTEGDFQKALSYSKRSLELQPGEASFLDTCARCFYATGDLESALEYQRSAVEKEPHVQALHRQLKFFEQELAKR